MKFSYLNDKNWASITRDERFFCAHLFFEIKNNAGPFLNFLFEKNIILKEDTNPVSWEVSFEVCFFRDYIFEVGEKNGNKSIKKSNFSQKRTFDLCLFSEKSMIIIEAKSYTGFNTIQLKSFEEDKANIKSMLGDNCPSIFSIALVPELYNHKPESLIGFDCKLTWKEMYDLYKNDVILRANRAGMIVKDE